MAKTHQLMVKTPHPGSDAALECKINNCERIASGTGYCLMHNKRFLRNGYYEKRSDSVKFLADRFWKQVDRNDNAGCWLWTGAVTGGGSGYGYMSMKRGNQRKAHRAHRIAWALEHGDIDFLNTTNPLHHLCGNTLCVNPTHILLCSDRKDHFLNHRGEHCESGRHSMAENRMSDGRCRVCHKEGERRRLWRVGGKSWPNPGSDESVWLGCRCGTLDNEHGRGYGIGEDGALLFCINQTCPLHGQKKENSHAGD